MGSLVYILVVEDALTDSFEVKDVFESEYLAEQARDELVDSRLSINAIVLEKEVI